MQMQSMRVVRVVLIGSAAAAGLGSTSALAVDCDVNVFDAYQTAVKRGWGFKCYNVGNLGMTINFTTYPPHSIGCVIKTPPVTTNDKLGYATFFRHSTGAAPTLGNGWSVNAFEVEGIQWIKAKPLGYPSSGFDRVVFTGYGGMPNRTYNARLSRLTLAKVGGSCAKSIDEAF
jgi:hypothetical protein